MALKRIHRLRERSRFETVRRTGSCRAERLLVICWLPNQLPWNRYGFSVSRRVGKAVVRNRVRRRMREVVRLRHDSLQPGWDVVFIARPPIAQARYEQIERVCDRLLRQADLIQREPLAASDSTEDTSSSRV